MVQIKLPNVDEFFLSERLAESRTIVRNLAHRTEKPLIIQFSGGRDSMAVLGLVKSVTENLVCAYMATGLEFPGVLQFVRKVCRDMGVELLVSTPAMHKGNFFKRIAQFRKFPGIPPNFPWCCRDLKINPQRKMLESIYGKGTYYKLEGVRLAESSRRKYIYKGSIESLMRPDSMHPKSYEVFPILKWTNDDVLNYLKDVEMPTSELYETYGVSGCSWCPFYGPDIYRRVLCQLPKHYDRFIAWEEELCVPSVIGQVYLRDLRNEVVSGIPMPELVEEEAEPTRRPCTMIIDGQEVATCDVYGHFYMDGRCYRCGTKEVEP